MQNHWTKYSTILVVLILLGSLAFFGIHQYKRYQESATIKAQITALKAEAGNIEEKNKELEDSLKYLTSTGATERLAKQQMNLEREGEITVVFLPQESNVVKQEDANKPHWREWWDYFFQTKV